jgi:hypothetical protein
MSESTDLELLRTSLGLAPITQISTQEIWDALVTPLTKELIGPIVSQEVRLIQTVEGLFPGDEVSNMSDHRLFGGKAGFVRNPYIHTFCRTERGAFIVKRDTIKVTAFCWVGDVLNGKGELIFKLGMRDNRFDGTPYANESALMDYPYDDPLYAKPLGLAVNTVELSTYAYMPGTRLSRAKCPDATGGVSRFMDYVRRYHCRLRRTFSGKDDQGFQDFVRNPFDFQNRPRRFRAYLRRVWQTDRYPGQIGAPLPDFGKLILPACYKFAQAYGYDAVLMAPSHYNVVFWTQKYGCEIIESAMQDRFKALQDGLATIRRRGLALTRQQESWVCALQNLRPARFIPKEFDLGGPIWPQDDIGQQNIWVARAITEKGQRALNQAQSAPKKELTVRKRA